MTKIVDVYSDPPAAQLLYDLMAEREAHQNISHKSQPSFEGHLAFVASRPYEAWYLIVDDASPSERVPNAVGSIYLSKAREVGIFIFKAHMHQGFGKAALALLRCAHPGRILANVATGNAVSQRFFALHGGKLIQVTYELP